MAIPQIERYIANDNYLAAVDLAREAEKRIPGDATLMAFWPQISQVLSFETDPPGAEVFFKEYAKPQSPWRSLGITPLANVTSAAWFLRMEDYKAGITRISTLPREHPPIACALLSFASIHFRKSRSTEREAYPPG